MRIAQVVGTNGKGTTAVALAAALEAAGLPSGAYLSPHLFSYTERVVLRGEFVSEERFATAMGGVMKVADANGVPASQFELLTAGALEIFADEDLSWAVLEAGLGARYDATTAAAPEVVVLTNIGLDHTEYLGETAEEISREKLSSLRPDPGHGRPRGASGRQQEVRRSRRPPRRGRGGGDPRGPATLHCARRAARVPGGGGAAGAGVDGGREGTGLTERFE